VDLQHLVHPAVVHAVADVGDLDRGGSRRDLALAEHVDVVEASHQVCPRAERAAATQQEDAIGGDDADEAGWAGS
jgi:hypothetical protein